MLPYLIHYSNPNGGGSMFFQNWMNRTMIHWESMIVSVPVYMPAPSGRRHCREINILKCMYHLNFSSVLIRVCSTVVCTELMRWLPPSFPIEQRVVKKIISYLQTLESRFNSRYMRHIKCAQSLNSLDMQQNECSCGFGAWCSFVFHSAL